nr:hypothetical protein [Halomonas sp. UBA3074]
MGKILAVVLLMIVALGAHGSASFPEPFGLTWGMSEAELNELGFTQASESDGLKIFSSVSAPKAWSKAEVYIAITYKGNLVKAAASSTDFIDDIYGLEGKRNYNQIKDLLIKKYGEPSTNYERTGGTLYDEADEFYQCLEYSGCGVYLSIFEFSGGLISVQLQGKRRGQGYLSIAYESPQFAEAKSEIERGDLELDSDAF